MDWTTLGVQGIIIIAATFVLRSCFEALVRRDTELSIERFRHDCTRELETARHEMNQILERDKIAFGGVFARRMESLGRLHELLSDAHGQSRQIVQAFSIGEPPKKEDMSSALAVSLGELHDHIKKNCVYWPAAIEDAAMQLGNGCFWEVHKYFTAKSRQETASKVGLTRLDRYYESEDKAREAIERDLASLMTTVKSLIRESLEGQVPKASSHRTS